MQFSNTLTRLFSAARPRRRRSASYASETLENRIVLSAMTGVMIPAEFPVLVASSENPDDLTPQGWALGDLNVQGDQSADGSEYQLRGFAIADLGFAADVDGGVLRGLSSSPLGVGGQEGEPATLDGDGLREAPVLRGLSSSPLGFAALQLGGQEGEDDTASEDPTVLRGLASVPLGFRTLAPAVADGEDADNSESSEDDPTVLRGLASSPIGFGMRALGGQEGEEATSDEDPTVLRGLASIPPRRVGILANPTTGSSAPASRCHAANLQAQSGEDTRQS